MAVKARFKGTAWTRWAQDIRLRWQNALDYYRRELYYDIEFHQYLQFKFSQQWKKLKSYANANGIRIIGDIPIYVAMDSADTWPILNSLSWTGTIYRPQLQAALLTAFPPQDSSGEIPCTAGNTTAAQAMNGGWPGWLLL